ncbi:hypothetical protein COCSUDRAFT_56597 [Coccomyxa subellipsoidea C-169]|uniref:CCHC-type domain-containing protein n=1 Tax=Coccomyxa subellipsoidea (strain C-169) TaxID=574566 RepID=I0YSK9_COCSC|nr:hypothetical protein COCSUDRAFT_56597 [Coccomyxa subellipsoidea C-169]EIE21378.1 hypothetical protein COCSUDRAFT_56597 [Coccomyxa subellipsoidea C-169]|eukprot:XP_005645922.1 hypothetical protein COCSUDRAFT_56597 [Coccomyxa subellipsoidea C-169]
MAGEEQDTRIAALEDQVADLQEQVVALFKYQASMEKTLEVLLSNADIAWNVSTTFEAFISESRMRCIQAQQQQQQNAQQQQEQQLQQQQQAQPLPQPHPQQQKLHAQPQPQPQARPQQQRKQRTAGKPPGKPKAASKAASVIPKKRVWAEIPPGLDTDVKRKRLKARVCMKCGLKGHHIKDCKNDFNPGKPAAQPSMQQAQQQQEPEPG